jgi:hypothetical protein
MTMIRKRRRLMLTQNDTKFWSPVREVWDHLLRIIPSDARVMDIGPGTAPFPRSDVVVDFQRFPGIPENKLVMCDLASERLPFRDKSYDFIYCRHVLEDMFNPFPLCAEMGRVGKAGYCEVPSPLAEITRGIDGGSPHWRGYHHHRWVIWVEDEVLTFTSKYPLIEYCPLAAEEMTDAVMRSGPKYWNTNLIWRDKLPVRHKQNVLDYMLPGDYPEVLTQAASEGMRSTDAFWKSMEEK